MTGAGSPAPPVSLTAEHDRSAFSCGIDELDDWFRRRALVNQQAGATRTYVSAVGLRAVGYHALAAGSLLRDEATSRISRNMPDPIPVILIARLAVDQAWQGQGLGETLLLDAVERCAAAAELIGARAILVHAISPKAQSFYEAYGFVGAPGIPRTLMLAMQDVRRLFDA
jgi:GNAT superfamily N-acetyltransferase